MSNNIDFGKVDWPDILSRFGVDVRDVSPAKHYPCPIPGAHADNRPRFRFDNKDGRGTWICSCGAGDGVRLVANVEHVDDAEAVRRIKAKLCHEGVIVVPIRQAPALQSVKTESQKTWLKRLLTDMWDQSLPVKGTPVQAYLERRVRGFDINCMSAMIRYHPSLEYRDEDTGKVIGKYPAMLARVVDVDGKPVTLHRTYLTQDGFKAPVAQVKKQMAGNRKLDGDAIRLNKPIGNSGKLIVCEGIEKGYALVMFTQNRHEVWSLLNAGNLAKAKVPTRFSSTLIGSDRDKVCSKGYRPGEHYAELLMARLKAEGRPCDMRVPKEEGVDFCDLWNRRMSA